MVAITGTNFHVHYLNWSNSNLFEDWAPVD